MDLLIHWKIIEFCSDKFTKQTDHITKGYSHYF